MVLDLSLPIKLLPLTTTNHQQNKNNNNKPAITIKLTEEILNQLNKLNSKGNLNEFKIDLNDSNSPFLSLNGSNFKISIIKELENSEILNYNKLTNSLHKINSIESKISILPNNNNNNNNQNNSSSLEKVSITLRESNDAIEKERESRRTVLLEELPSTLKSRPSPSFIERRTLSPALPHTSTLTNSPRLGGSKLINSISPPLISSTSTSISTSNSIAAGLGGNKFQPVKPPSTSFRIGTGTGSGTGISSNGSNSHSAIVGLGLGIISSSSSTSPESKIKTTTTSTTASTTGSSKVQVQGGIMKGKESLKKDAVAKEKEQDKLEKNKLLNNNDSKKITKEEKVVVEMSEGEEEDADGEFEEVLPLPLPTTTTIIPNTIKSHPSLPAKPISNTKSTINKLEQDTEQQRKKQRKLMNNVLPNSSPNSSSSGGNGGGRAPTPVSRISTPLASTSMSTTTSTNKNNNSTTTTTTTNKRSRKSERYYTSSSEEESLNNNSSNKKSSSTLPISSSSTTKTGKKQRMSSAPTGSTAVGVGSGSIEDNSDSSNYSNYKPNNKSPISTTTSSTAARSKASNRSSTAAAAAGHLVDSNSNSKDSTTNNKSNSTSPLKLSTLPTSTTPTTIMKPIIITSQKSYEEFKKQYTLLYPTYFNLFSLLSTERQLLESSEGGGEGEGEGEGMYSLEELKVLVGKAEGLRGRLNGIREAIEVWIRESGSGGGKR